MAGATGTDVGGPAVGDPAAERLRQNRPCTHVDTVHPGTVEPGTVHSGTVVALGHVSDADVAGDRYRAAADPHADTVRPGAPGPRWRPDPTGSAADALTPAAGSDAV